MNIDMNESRSLATTDELRARAVYALKFAVIAGVILACSESSSPASSQELPPAPVIEHVTGGKAAEFAGLLSKYGYEGVQFVALAYGEGEQETLLVLQFSPDQATDPEPVAQDYFQIPPVGTTFDEAVVLYTRSPTSVTTCGRAEGGGRSCRCIPLGGTPYC